MKELLANIFEELDLLTPEDIERVSLFARSLRTRNKRASNSLHFKLGNESFERDARFHVLAEAMPYVVWQLSPQGRVTFLNQQWVNYVGPRFGQFKSSDWIEIIHPDDLPKIRTLWQQASSAQSPGNMDGCRIRLKRADGVYRWFANRMVAVYDSDHKLRYWIGTSTDIEDFVQAEDSLRSKRKFQLLADSIPQLAWIADTKGSMLWFNQRWYDYSGGMPEDFAGSDWEKVHHPDHVERVIEDFRRSLETGLPWDDTFPLRRKDGVYCWFLSRARPQFDEDGKVLRWFGTHTDVTAQRQSEADQQFLFELGAALQAKSNSSEIAQVATEQIARYFGVERCGWFSIDQANQLFAITQEYVRDGLIPIAGVHALAILGAEGYTSTLASGQTVAIDDASVDPRTCESYSAHPDMPRSIVLTPVIRDRKWLGAVGMAQSSVRNWTEREIKLIQLATERAWPAFESSKALALERIMMDSLADREERLLLTLHAARIGTWDFNPASGKFLCDERCKIAFGFEREQAVEYQMLMNAIHQEESARVNALIDRAFNAARSAAISHVEFECRTVGSEDARLRHISCRCQIFFDSRNGSLPAFRFIGVVEDKTELKEKENALRRANSELEQFAYAAAHDLQEPLRNVGLSMQILAGRLSDTVDADTQACLTIALQGSLRMQAMVKDLLAYSRALDGSDPTNLVSDSNQVLANVLADLQAAIRERDAKITWDVMGPVRVQTIHLSQIFQNLIGNALKYAQSGETPRIHVATSHRDGECIFAIRDNGIGIHPDYHARVFGVFRRLRQLDVPGTGIGLALCKRIVEHYGGRIWIESNGDSGSTFLFTVPAVERKNDEQRLSSSQS